MGRNRKYANDSQKTKAYRFNKKGIEYEIVDGFVHEKRVTKSVNLDRKKPDPGLEINNIIGIMIQKQKLLVNLYRNRGTHRKALDALYELDLEILKILAE